MSLAETLQVVQTVSIVLGIIVAAGTLKSRGDVKVSDMTEIKTDLRYIKETIKCVPNQTLQIELMRKEVEALSQRLTDHIKASEREE